MCLSFKIYKFVFFTLNKQILFCALIIHESEFFTTRNTKDAQGSLR